MSVSSLSPPVRLFIELVLMRMELFENTQSSFLKISTLFQRRTNKQHETIKLQPVSLHSSGEALDTAESVLTTSHVMSVV